MLPNWHSLQPEKSLSGKWRIYFLFLIVLSGIFFGLKTANAAGYDGVCCCNDGSSSIVQMPYMCRSACEGSGGMQGYDMPVCRPACSTSSYTENASCGGGWQTGNMTRTVTTNTCSGTTYSDWDSGACGCYSGYEWNGSSCVAKPPSCSPSSSTSTQSCGGGWQTGSIRITTTTYSDCTTSQSQTDNCGCYSGYEWNGSSCVRSTPSCTPSTSSSNQSCSAYGWQTGVVTTITRTYSDCSTSQSETDNCGCYFGNSWNGWMCAPDTQPEDGACGGSLNSCSSGSFSDASDSSTNYLWNCYGIAGGSSTGCSQAKPGKCGFANGNTYSSSPTSASALCSLGSTSSVSGSGPWTWTCSAPGGTANCSANYCAPPVKGVCNNSVTNSCSAGNLVDLTDSSTSYLWQCQGLNGGADSPECSKTKP